MHFGPILWRELVVSSRRQRIFSMRAGIAGLMLLAVAGSIVWWSVTGNDRTSVGGMARLAQVAFGSALAIQALATLMVVIEEMAQALPRERERKTLDGVLASGSSSAEIVLGVLGAGLVQGAACTATGLPIVLLLVPLMGIDFRLILLGYAALGATTFATAAFALAISIGRRSRRSASMGAALAIAAWMELPLLTVLILPMVWRAGSSWAVPLAIRLLDASPAGLIATVFGLVNRGDPLLVLMRMIAYEIAIGVCLAAWATVRFRPVCRSLADADSRLLLARRRRTPRCRASCGDDAMLWKELHETRGLGLGASLIQVLLPGGFGLGSLYFAWYALHELIARGYGTFAGDSAPGSAFEWAFVLARGIPLTTGQARGVFNLVLREITLVSSLTLALVGSEMTVVGITRERDQNTWAGLLATPLSAWEILRAKMVGAFWKLRWGLGSMVGLWTIGLVVGSVHPLGFLGALVVLFISTGFIVVLGTTRALRPGDCRQAQGSCVFAVVLLSFSGLLPRVLPPSVSSVLFGAGSFSLLLWMALVSYHDVDSASRTGSYPQFELLVFDTGEGASTVVATCLIGLIGYALAAAFMIRSALRGFDAAVGRTLPEPPVRFP